jgi:hypothetical protein
VAYLSKQIDAVSQGWLHCLHTLAATAVLVAEEDKLTLGQGLTVLSSNTSLAKKKRKKERSQELTV